MTRTTSAGTLVIGDLMRDYFLTAIEEHISYSMDPDNPDIENWENSCGLFVDFIQAQLETFPSSGNKLYACTSILSLYAHIHKYVYC